MGTSKHTRADLQALIERVEKATGPDRDLDAEICATLEGGEIVWKQANYTMEMYPALHRPSTNHVGGFVNEHCPLITGSVDAALALLGRVLPGWAVAMERWKSECSAKLWECDDKGWHRGGTGRSEAIAATLPLAIIAATLHALLAARTKGEDNGNG